MTPLPDISKATEEVVKELWNAAIRDCIGVIQNKMQGNWTQSQDFVCEEIISELEKLKKP